MRVGVRIGIDVGTARVGVARSDSQGTMAVPVETLPRDTALTRLDAMATEYEPIEFVCGLPLALSGNETASTEDARNFAAALHELTAIPVRLIDERLTTVTAHSNLRSAQHTAKSGRDVVDQVAATILLDIALDAERAGNTLGEMVGES